MFEIYKAKKIYILKLAKVTEVKLPGLWTKGYTQWHNLDNVAVAKLLKVKTEYGRKVHFYKLIRTGEIVHDNHADTVVGDLLVTDKDSLTSCLERPVLLTTKKALLELEDYLNNPEEETKVATTQSEPQLSK